MIHLAFDFGEKRIGAAVGDDLTATARPLPVLNTGEWKAIERTIADWRPAELVVGLPLDEAGAEQEMSAAARKFATELHRRTKLPVHLCDERFSSRSADDELRSARANGHMNRRVRKGDRDGEAARILLEQWFQQRKIGSTAPLPDV